MAEQKSSGAAQAPKKDLKTVKAEQKARRKTEKIEAKEAKKAKKANKRGFFKQIADVFKMTRKFDPSIVWWMVKLPRHFKDVGYLFEEATLISLLGLLSFFCLNFFSLTTGFLFSLNGFEVLFGRLSCAGRFLFSHDKPILALTPVDNLI